MDEGCPPGPFDRAKAAAHAVQEPPALLLSCPLGTLLPRSSGRRAGGQHPVCPETSPVLYLGHDGDAELSLARVRPWGDGAGLSACSNVGLCAHLG